LALEEEKREAEAKKSTMALGGMAFAGNLFRKLSKSLTNSPVPLQNEKKTELKMNYLVLYKDFKQEKPKYAYFMIIDLIRHLLLASILVLMFKHPYVQIILINSLNLFMFIYLLIVRPFSRLKDIIQNTVNEMMVSICTCACTYLAYLDRIGDMNVAKRMNAGWVIHYVNMILMFFFTTIFFVELLFAMKEILPKAIKLIREKVIKYRRTGKNRIMNPRSEFTMTAKQDEEGRSMGNQNIFENFFQTQNTQLERAEAVQTRN
jgi:hypothetical protein